MTETGLVTIKTLLVLLGPLSSPGDLKVPKTFKGPQRSLILKSSGQVALMIPLSLWTMAGFRVFTVQQNFFLRRTLKKRWYRYIFVKLLGTNNFKREKIN